MSTSPHQPAFPTPDNVPMDLCGMTMREHFAALALQGILANPSWNTGAIAAFGVSEAHAVRASGIMATYYADALIAALNKEPS